MEDFMTNLNLINKKPGIIYIYHKLFGSQTYNTDNVNLICDGARVGIKLNGRDIYIPMNEIHTFSFDKNGLIIKSDRQCIRININ
jgi:hypothetical protein